MIRKRSLLSNISDIKRQKREGINCENGKESFRIFCTYHAFNFNLDFQHKIINLPSPNNWAWFISRKINYYYKKVFFLSFIYFSRTKRIERVEIKLLNSF